MHSRAGAAYGGKQNIFLTTEAVLESEINLSV
jgi:hypothetical protein